MKKNKKDGNYTIVSNYFLQDKQLSLKAKGLFALMLSLPDDWDYSIKGLESLCKDGKDSISSALKELETAGYVVRDGYTKNELGHFKGIKISIVENPRNLSKNFKDCM